MRQALGLPSDGGAQVRSGSLVLGPTSAIVECSAEAAALCLPGRVFSDAADFSEFVGADDREALAAFLGRCVVRPAQDHVEFVLFTPGVEPRRAGLLFVDDPGAVSVRGLRLTLAVHEGGFDNLSDESTLMELGVKRPGAFVARWDRDLKCTFASGAYAGWFGFEPEDMIGRHVAEVIGIALYTSNEPMMRHALEGESFSFERVLKSRDGRTTDAWVQYLPDDTGPTVTGFYVLVTDITVLRRAQSERREIDERFQFAMEAAELGAWHMDFRTGEVSRSLLHDRCFGFADVIPNWSHELFLSLVHPLDRARVESAFDAARSGSGAPDYDMEYRIIWPDGSTHWIWSKGHFYFDSRGIVHRVSGVRADITARRQAFEERLVDAARIKMATEGSNTGLWEWRFSTNEIYLSAIWKRQLGYAYEELPNSLETWQSLLHPEDAGAALATAVRAREQQSPFFENRFRMRHRDGSYRHIVARCALLRDDRGGVIGMVGSHLDVTEQLAAEEALRATELSFRAVIDASPVPFAINDADGNVTFLNLAFIKTFGYTLEDIPRVAQWWERAYPDEAYRAWVRATWSRRLESVERSATRFEPLEVAITCKDGSARTAVVDAVELRGSFRETHLVMLVDVTEQRVLEADILSAVSREQHRIGMDLHDGLGQELTGVSLMLGAMRQKLPGDPESPMAKDMDRLAGLISHSIKSARAMAHGLAPVDLSSGGLPSAVLRMVEDARGVSAMRIDVDIEGDGLYALPVKVSEGLYRITQEAVGNALKHSGAARVSVVLSRVEDLVTVAISDDGLGLPKKKKKSSGIGLDTMKYRARALGARLDLLPTPNGGTRVCCVCPVPSAGEAALE
jgi:PAS domain S-box-containing protein